MNINNIYSALNYLNIEYRNIKNDWLECLCPMHADNNFGNAAININTGIINCLACNKSKHIRQLLEVEGKMSYKAAQAFLGIDEVGLFMNSLQRGKSEKNTEVKEKLYVDSHVPYKFLQDIDISKSAYLQLRGFTKEFIDFFDIKVAHSDYYKDYMIIPIVDKVNRVFSFEARKIYEFEYLQKVFNLDTQKYLNMPTEPRKVWLDRLKNKYLNLPIEQQTKEITDYLLRKKVLYPRSSNIDTTIWNFTNLNKDEDLIVSEGICTNPKVWSNITKNCSAVFGVSFTKEQVELLRQFKRIILIFDLDDAGIMFIEKLSKELDNLWVYPINSEDTSTSFVDDIRSTEPIEATRFLIRYKGYMNFK